MNLTLTPKSSIALVTQGYERSGGVQTVARWLRDGLSAAGLDVTVYDCAVSRSDELSRRLAAPRTWLRGPTLARSAVEANLFHVGANWAELEPLRYLPRRTLTLQLERHNAVLVVAGGSALALVARSARRPVILQVATSVTWERASQLDGAPGVLASWRRLATGLVRLLEDRALRRADAVMVENVAMQAFAIEAGAKNVVLAPPGVDTTRYRPRTEGWNREGPILSVCRLNDRRKGLPRLIESYARLNETFSSTPRLVLAGRDSPSPEVLRAIETARLGAKVEIRQDVAADDLPELYREASIYLQTSYEEGLGISVLEAMASGLPVIATETAGTRETVAPGQTGILVNQGADVPSVVAMHAERLLTGDGARYGAAGRERAEREFSTTATLQRFVEVYVHLTGSA